MATKEQYCDLSCGAACLLCVAEELGELGLPAVRDWAPLWEKKCTLKLTDDCEKRIYSITSGLSGAAPDDDNMGYSYPSYIMECAKQLNLASRAYVPDSILGKLAKWKYRADLKRALRLDFNLKSRNAPTPRRGKRLIRLLRCGDPAFYSPLTELHWVMERDDGSIMDPAHGEEYASLEACKRGMKREHEWEYSNTNIGVLLWRMGD